MLKQALGLFIALSAGLGLRAQLTETMGTLGSSTETIAVHQANHRFDLINLTYSGTADVRTTTPSSGYPGASGSFNVLIQAQETFQVQAINAAGCGPKDSISFGINKNTNAATGIDYLLLEYSADNGATWVSIPYPALPTGTGTSKWYRRAAAIPAGAKVNNLWLRFRSTLVGTSSTNPQYRIDDMHLSCGSDAPCAPSTVTVAVTGPTVYCEGGSGATLTATTNLANPLYQWYDQNGPITGAETNVYAPTASGSYNVRVSNENGCESISAKTYILVYPRPAYCTAAVQGCSTDTVEVCFSVQAQGLLISQYVEGNGFNKYLELYNGTCKNIDLSGFEIRAYHNGALITGLPTYTIPLSGILNVGSAYVIAHPSATAYTGTPNLISANMQFNGNDAIVLYNVTDGQPADIFGSVGHDPGTAWRDGTVSSPTYGWRTENKTLVRKSCVFSGITVNPDLAGIGGFPTLFTEWDTLSVDNVTGLGTHDIFASNYTFSVASGNAAVVYSGGSCAQVVPGDGVSTIAIDGTFCTFNNCNDINNTAAVTGYACAAKQAFVPATRGTVTAEALVFPNPFTDGITVSFTNTVAGNVQISVVDLYGKTVAVWTNQPLEAGAHSFRFDASNLAPGTYVCRIHTSEGQETLRIIKSGK